ncbi:MAG: hypothetical protein V4634_19990 [Pseudomonadota bacterium]
MKFLENSQFATQAALRLPSERKAVAERAAASIDEAMDAEPMKKP